MIYFDHAATSWPKPDGVAEAISRYLREVGVSPGRSGHRLAVDAERARLDARETIAELFGLGDPLRVIFTLNATTALNLVIRGLLPPGSHAVTTSMEHNSVMRPLRVAQQNGVSVSIVPCQSDGTMDAAAIDEHLRPETRLIIINHASNVCGTVLPIREIGLRARAHGIPFLVDAAQTAGCRPVDIARENIDLLVFAGHKGMLGPTGTGGLAFNEDFDVRRLPALIHGGTGSGSEQDAQPDVLPDKYEGGTPNTVGIAGLAAGVRYVLDRGVDRIGEHERKLATRLIDGLQGITQVRVFGASDPLNRTATVSFTIAGQSVSDVAHALDERFAIMCRPGLHCAPQAHRTLGTFPHGTVRLAPGPFNTEAQVDEVIRAVESLVTGD